MSDHSAGDLEAALLARDGQQRGDEITFRCPNTEQHKNGDAHPSASYNVAKRVWCCRVCGGKGGENALRQELGLRRNQRRQHRSESNRDAATGQTNDNAKFARRIWSKTVSAEGTLVEIYLRARGITGPVPGTIRFHPRLKHGPSDGHFPAMVSAVTHGLVSELTAIHRTFLALDGSGKAALESAKMMLGPCSGSVVRLADPGETIRNSDGIEMTLSTTTLVICEGIETGLSVLQAIGVAVWAALSTSGMEALDALPAEITDIIIAADADEPGKKAARTAALRSVCAGKRVRIAMPPAGIISGRDFNDVLRDEGEQAIRDIIAAAEEVKHPLDGMVERAAEDPGVAFAPEVIEQLRKLRQSDLAAFEALRSRLRKETDVRVTVLDDKLDGRDGDDGNSDNSISDLWVKPADGKTVLAPGLHILGHDADRKQVLHEQGADDFARDILTTIPAGVLYRWDHMVGRIMGEPGARRFVPLTEHEMRTVVDEHARIVRISMVKKVVLEEFRACNRDYAAVVLAGAAFSERVRKLEMLTNYPVYQRGLVLAQQGWNEASGIYYDEPPELAGLVPCAEGAVAALRDLTIDFPFRDEASRQNLYGVMLTIILRPAIEGTIPLLLFMACLERTGKGKLINTALGFAILGRGIPVLQIGSTEEEREKRITSLILQGTTTVHLDNLPIGEVLDSASLASLTTAWPTWTGRVLGVSRLPQLPNRLLVLLSANNPRATGEIVKRMLPIVLQPKAAHPEDRRDFVHPDAEGYGLSRRRIVLQAMLGMVEQWKAAGCPSPQPEAWEGADGQPDPHGRRIGGFERWTAIIGGVLAHAGCSRWLGNYRAWVRASDEVAADAEALVEAWAKAHGSAEISARQVLELVEQTGTFPEVTGRPWAGRLVCLAKRVLTPLTSRPVGGWIVKRIGSGNTSRYRLDPALPTDSAPADGGFGGFGGIHSNPKGQKKEPSSEYTSSNSSYRPAEEPPNPPEPPPSPTSTSAANNHFPRADAPSSGAGAPHPSENADDEWGEMEIDA